MLVQSCSLWVRHQLGAHHQYIHIYDYILIWRGQGWIARATSLLTLC